jgi:hypothetical protein
MTIVEKHYNNLSLTPAETANEKVMFLQHLGELKLIIKSLSKDKQERINKILSLLLLYYPKDWKQTIFKNLQEEVIEKLIEEENK